MGDYLKSVLSSGRQILGDTKAPAKPKAIPKATSLADTESDPHKIFVKRTVSEKPKKNELIKDIERFIKQAEDSL